MTETDIGVRKRIAEFLPSALQKAIESYQQFMEKEHVKSNEKDDKSGNKDGNFKTHHDACKVALAHIELLVKLEKWAGQPDSETARTDMRALLLSANAELGEGGHDAEIELSS